MNQSTPSLNTEKNNIAVNSNKILKSRRIYVQGSRKDIQVPFKEVRQENTNGISESEKNPAITIYDTSGPFGDESISNDPDSRVDIKKGIVSLRSPWIDERKDTEQLSGPSSIFGKERIKNSKVVDLKFPLHKNPRRAKNGNNVTQMHYARKNIITPEMEFVAIRENLRRKNNGSIS